MRKTAAVICAAITAVMMSSCSPKQETASELDTAAVAAILDETVHFAEDLTEVSPEVTLRRYGLESADAEEVAAYAGTQAVVDEIAVFKTKDTDKVLNAVNARIESQKTTYSSYAPNEVPKLDDAVIETAGDCVIVCVSADDSETVRAIISGIKEG